MTTHPLSSLGCLICASPAVVASVSVEVRPGILGHYPACRAHIEAVARRVLDDTGDVVADVVPLHTTDAIDTDAVLIRPHIGEVLRGND